MAYLEIKIQISVPETRNLLLRFEKRYGNGVLPLGKGLMLHHPHGGGA